MSEMLTETAMQCLDRALDAMNRAVGMTAEQGPAAAMEFIADFLNNSDGIDEAVANAAPDDWLTRWRVVKGSELDGATDPGDPRCHSSSPGEFAARWNSRTEEQQAQHLLWIQEDAEDAQRWRRGQGAAS